MKGIKKILEHQDWQLLRKYAGYFKPHKKWFFFSIASIPVTTAAGILFLWLVENIVDNYIVPGNVDGLIRQIIFWHWRCFLIFFSTGFTAIPFPKPATWLLLTFANSCLVNRCVFR